MRWANALCVPPVLTNVCYDAWQKLLAKHLPRLSKHITKQLCKFFDLSEAEYKQSVKDKDMMR